MKRINLIPIEIRQKRLGRKKRNIKLAGVLVVILAVAGSFYLLNLKVKSIKVKIKEVKSDLKNVEFSEEEMKAQFEQIQLEREKVKAERQVLAQKIALLHQFQQKGSSWSTALVQIADLMPESIWLRKVYLTEDVISVAGASTDSTMISKFMSNLDASQLFKNTDFNYIQKVEFDEIPYIEFEITTQAVVSELKR